MPKIFQNKVFQDAEAARTWLEGQLWPTGPICGHCGTIGEAKALASRPGVYQCNACRKQFTVTVGTVFERSHIPLNKWLMATFLFCASKKGVSAHQMHRLLGITYKSAWFMMHRLRHAVAPGSDAGPLGGPGKIVEADETYLLKASGKRKADGAGGYAHKMKVLALVERGGDVRSMRLAHGSKAEIKANLHANVDPASTLHTDRSNLYTYTGLVADHEAVDHSKQYVRKGKHGKVHTNTLEGYFSIFKRGVIGTFHHIGEQHLDRYLAEFDFRQNNRAAVGVDDEARAVKALAGIVGKRLTYRQTNAATDTEAEG